MTFIHNIDPVLFTLGPLEIRYYGLIYVLGIIFVYFFLNYLAKRRHLELDSDKISDYLVYAVLGMLLGARIFYVVVYNLPYYLHNPLSAFAVWQGGLSFHGGLLGVFIGSYLWCKKNKFNLWLLADLMVIPVALVLAFGRIANFINGELIGKVTSLPWGVNFNNEVINGERVFRHPSQIYATIKDLIIFTTLFLLKDKEWKEGRKFWLFILMYGTLRFLVGFYRLPDPQIGYILGLTLGQYINLIMIVLGGYMFWKWRK